MKTSIRQSSIISFLVNADVLKCNEFLVAKLGHEDGRQPHFAHQGDHNCKGFYMSAVHKLAEQINF